METKLNPLNKSEPIQMTKTVFGTQHTLVGFLNVNRFFFLHTALAENSIDQRLDTVIKQLKAFWFSKRFGLYCGKGIIKCHSFREAESALLLGEAKKHCWKGG
ncbi:hypothetical protein [Peribacillus simplex]|uniref:hypothetical protein n=1 Tax=Peribacillus TaxID=2675229 RepID=UPI0036DF5F3A